MTWIAASPAPHGPLGHHRWTARLFRYLNWPSSETEWKRCQHKHRTRKGAVTCGEQMVEAHKICGASDCENEGAVRCWYDDGKVSLRIQACLPCRERLEGLGLLTVDRAEDRPHGADV